MSFAPARASLRPGEGPPHIPSGPRGRISVRRLAVSMPEITPALPVMPLHLARFSSAVTQMPTAAPYGPLPLLGKGRHVSHGDEPLAYLRRRIALGGVHVAGTNGRPAGFIDRTGDDILSLYIAPPPAASALAVRSWPRRRGLCPPDPPLRRG